MREMEDEDGPEHREEFRRTLLFVVKEAVKIVLFGAPRANCRKANFG